VRSALLLLLALGFAARAGKPPKRSADLVARGRAAYAIWCVACHGESGAGDGATAHTLDPRPRNFSSGKFKQGSGVNQIFATLGKGVPGSAMVAYKNLSDEERWALSWYVLELKAGRK
jgi:mono/diheme cytochrome c family protein